VVTLPCSDSDLVDPHLKMEEEIACSPVCW